MNYAGRVRHRNAGTNRAKRRMPRASEVHEDLEKLGRLLGRDLERGLADAYLHLADVRDDGWREGVEQPHASLLGDARCAFPGGLYVGMYVDVKQRGLRRIGDDRQS